MRLRFTAARAREAGESACQRRASLLGALLLLTSTTILAQPVAPTGAAARIERGKYLAEAGNCYSCHTRPGGPAFAGGVPFDTPFGTLYSTNITPDAETGIGKWSTADLQRAMHEGIGRDGSRLFPAFPYTSFTRVSDGDVSDIYTYLRTLQPVRSSPPGNGTVFSMRWPVAIWDGLFFDAGRFVPDAARSAEWNRGAYLVEGLGHCGACHTPRNALLAEQSDHAYGGGTLQYEVAAGKVRRWSAVNLTSGKNGLGAWSVTDLARYFQTGVSSRAGTFGPMNEVIVNSLELLTPEDLHAMAVYLKSLPGRPDPGEVVPAELVSAGAAIYKERCEKCHGSSGHGGFFSGPPLAGSAIVQGDDPASLINVIIYGPAIPKTVKFGAWETMQAYGEVLDDSQIAAVCNYVRGSWGNRASPVTTARVGNQR